MLLFVVFDLNQFARRSTSPGSMYAYTGRGLGAVGGVLSRWTLIWSYLFIGVAGMTGFTIFSRQFLDIAGIHASIPAFVFFAISAALCWTLAVKDIRLSSMLTLILEAISVLCILALAAIVLFKHGIAVDSDQVNLTGVTFSGMSFAVVACIFSLVGFESATALGGEARNPLQTIPKAVIWSLILTGLFFVFMGYVEVFGTRGQHDTLDTLATPLNTLAGLRLRRHAGRVRIPPKPTSRHRGRYGEDGHLRLGLAGCPRVPRALSPSLCGVRLWTAPGRRPGARTPDRW
jgi:amino acid transporter